MHYVMNVKALLKSERMNKMNCKVEKTKNANEVKLELTVEAHVHGNQI